MKELTTAKEACLHGVIVMEKCGEQCMASRHVFGGTSIQILVLQAPIRYAKLFSREHWEAKFTKICLL